MNQAAVLRARWLVSLTSGPRRLISIIKCPGLLYSVSGVGTRASSSSGPQWRHVLLHRYIWMMNTHWHNSFIRECLRLFLLPLLCGPRDVVLAVVQLEHYPGTGSKVYGGRSSDAACYTKVFVLFARLAKTPSKCNQFVQLFFTATFFCTWQYLCPLC